MIVKQFAHWGRWPGWPQVRKSFPATESFSVQQSAGLSCIIILVTAATLKCDITSTHLSMGLKLRAEGTSGQYSKFFPSELPKRFFCSLKCIMLEVATKFPKICHKSLSAFPKWSSLLMSVVSFLTGKMELKIGFHL